MKRSKKVIMLFSMSFLPNQGRYIRVYNQAKSLLKRFSEVKIIAWDREGNQPPFAIVDGIKVERLHIKAGIEKGPLGNGLKVLLFNLIAFGKLILNRQEIEVIHAFNLDTMLPAIAAAKLLKKPAILDLCEPDYYAFWGEKYGFFLKLVNWLEKVISRRFDAVLVHNQYQINKFKKYGVKRLRLIGSYPTYLVKQVKKHQNIEGKPVVIGRIGTIYANNGIEELVEAFGLLLKKHKNIKLMLAGRVYENYKETFRQLIRPLGDKAEVIGAFPASQMPQLYQKIDISVMLNRRTAWFKNITPTKFFDTLANGVPVVTSDIGGLKYIIEEYQCGYVVDETNPHEICAVLEKLVKNPSLRQKMAENGLKAAWERFNWNLMEKYLLEVYEDVRKEKLAR